MRPEEIEMLSTVKGAIEKLMKDTDWDLAKSPESIQKTIEAHAFLSRAAKKLDRIIGGADGQKV